MSFLSSIFGGDKKETPQPRSTPPAPKIGDAMIESTQREEQARLRKRKGLDDSILTTGLGDVGGEAGITRASVLGGAGK